MNHSWNADQLLTRYFNTPIRFYLSSGRTLDLADINTDYKRVHGTDSEGKCHILHKHNILFAFPVNRMPDVEPYIKLQPSKSVTFKVDNRELRRALKKDIVLTMHRSYVIHGSLRAVDNYHLFMRVANKVVLVYRHGVLNLRRSKVNDLHELRKKREKWVEINCENSFEEGIKHLLTDLYPDNAHFIYELLQNAEAVRASEVRFVLTNQQVEFEHNGNRLFSAKDVDAITSVGVSTKKDASTNIGKFGIGFKAVFAYTATPEIESGEYHFRIRDIVVPNTEGLDPGALGERRTRFIFPFNNPEKPPDKARTEIEDNLRQLNEITLLFLSHIRKIEYHLPDGSGSGFLERRKQTRKRIEISVKRPEDLIPNSTYYLRFQKIVSVRDEKDGKLKDCRIAVAFGMEQSDGQDWKIIPLNPGQVCIYFPAVKETSNLPFHLHAPFASTVACDRVRECPANAMLLKHLADLTAESMIAIRDRYLLNVEPLAVLPNDRNYLSDDYRLIQQRLIEAFNSEKLAPMK